MSLFPLGSLRGGLGPTTKIALGKALAHGFWATCKIEILERGLAPIEINSVKGLAL